MSNFYYYPEKHNLRIVGEYDSADSCGYEWDIVAVFQRTDTGEFLMGSDSGCSCYGPFERGDYGSVDGMLSPLDLDELKGLVDEEFFHKIRREVHDYEASK